MNDSVEVIIFDRNAVDGEKGIRSAVARVAASVVSIDPELLAANLSSFVRSIGNAFDRAAATTKSLSLDTLELTVEIGGKGQIRLVGGIESEIKGGVKLTFKKLTASSAQ